MQASGARSPLWFFYQRPPQVKRRRRGPAFWGSSMGVNVPQEQRFLVAWKKFSHCPPPPKFLGVSTWAQLLAIFLAGVALSLFSVLMSYLNIYIQKADKLNDQTLQMRAREKRLNDAIELLAGDHQGQQCKPCHNNTWLQRAESCYRRTDFVMPWGLCTEKCQAQGGRLFKAQTEGEMEFLLLESHKWLTIVDHHQVLQKVWIGLFFNLSQKTWHWVDGELMHIHIVIHITQPCFFSDCCLAISNGEAITDICTEEMSCLCEKSVH